MCCCAGHCVGFNSSLRSGVELTSAQAQNKAACTLSCTDWQHYTGLLAVAALLLTPVCFCSCRCSNCGCQGCLMAATKGELVCTA